MQIGLLLLPLLVLLLLVGVGVYLIVTSRQRTTDEPQCGQCGYNLTDSQANRCPECGSLFVDVGIVKGPRMRPGARGRFWVGLGLLILAGLILFSCCIGTLLLAQPTSGPPAAPPLR